LLLEIIFEKSLKRSTLNYKRYHATATLTFAGKNKMKVVMAKQLEQKK
jgi:hypothetical protein